MCQSGWKIPDPDPMCCAQFIDHGASPPAAAGPKPVVAATTGVTECPRIEQQRPSIMMRSGLREALSSEQQCVCGLRKRLRILPDGGARPSLHAMSLSAAGRKPAW